MQDDDVESGPPEDTSREDTSREDTSRGSAELRAHAGKRFSVVSVPHAWFILATSDELGRAPLARELMGVPIVLFRDRAGRAHALLDRCPHRNVPLSDGRVHEDGTLECPYHGWRFAGDGRCVAIPSLVTKAESTGADGRASAARRCARYPVIEQQGFVWVYSTSDAVHDGPPKSAPHRFALADDRRYVTVRQAIDMDGTLHAALENALDVPHTAFLHRGLFRAASRGIELDVRVLRSADRVEAEYVGEPRPEGFLARLLSPSGGVVRHFDRFLLPSIAQVEYFLGDELHLLADTAMTPLGPFRTRLYGVVSIRSRWPLDVIEPFVKPVALRVLQQDGRILAKQTALTARFGGERFASTEIDVLGKHIWHLLRAAERESGPVRELEERVRLVV